MTNPNNAIGTNAAYSGRTSVNSFNDVLSVLSRGIISGWACSPSSGLTVVLGGDGTTRDVAVAEDNIGNRTTINNISGSPISVTIGAAPSTNRRIDLIVAYVDNPPEGSSSITDNYEACGLVVVEGTPASSPIAPDDNAIRTAITGEGASGVTAYYVVLAQITIATGTTDIDATMITQSTHAGVANQNIQDETIGPEKFAQYSVNNAILTNANLSPASDTPTDWNTLLGKNGYFLTYYRQTGVFANQPEQYGMLETINYGGRIIQRWTGSSGVPYWRSGTAVGWSVMISGAFRKVLDDSPSSATGFPIEIYLGGNADLNNMTTSGIYRFYTPVSHGPSGTYQYCTTIVASYGNDYRCAQYFTGMQDDGKGVTAVRFSYQDENNNTRAWSDWKILAQWT